VEPLLAISAITAAAAAFLQVHLVKAAPSARLKGSGGKG
jgi:hypothetical protein